MDNSGENSEASSDENAMVIDENYVEKEDRGKQARESSSCKSASEGQQSEKKEMINQEEESDDDDVESGGEGNGEEDESGEEGSDEEEDSDDAEDNEDEGSAEGQNGEEEMSADDSGDDAESEEEADWETDGEDADPAGLLDSDSGDDGESCPICLNKFRGQDVGSPESCDHHFCLDCIMEWANNVNTCPVDRQVFHLILAKHADCENVYHRFPIEDKKVEESEDEELTYCEFCHECNREDRLLLCDSCDKGYHCECLDPPLDSVPIEEWFCPECVAQNQIERSSAESAADEAMESTSADDGNVSGVRRRRIPRTQASERVRTRIQANRQAIALMFDSEDDRTSSCSPVKKVTRKKKCTKKRTDKTTTRKTKKTRTKKRKTKTVKGKGRKSTKRKKKKRAKSKRTSSSFLSPRSSAVRPTITPKCRIAGRLGLSKPPVGRTIPLQKMGIEKSMEGRRAAIGITTLSILGSRDELLSFQDGEEAGQTEPQPVLSKYSRSALQSHCRVLKPRCVTSKKELSVKIAEPSTSSSSPDILGSILLGQNMLNMKGQDITINRDGSLTANKPVPADEENQCTEVNKDAPEASSKHAAKSDVASKPDVFEPIPKDMETKQANDDVTSEKEETTVINKEMEMNRSPYTDSEDGTTEFDKTVTDSPSRDRNKSPPPGWEPRPVTPPEFLSKDESDQRLTNQNEADRDDVTPPVLGASPEDISPGNVNGTPELEAAAAEQDSMQENNAEIAEDDEKPVEQETNEKLPVDAEQSEVDEVLSEPIASSAQFDCVLSVESDDSSKEDSRPRVPISELPRIPKKKRLPNPIEVITIEDEEEEETGGDQGRSVLQRVDLPDSKSCWEKKESKGKSEDVKRSSSDSNRRDKKISSRLSRHREMSDDEDNERRRSGADKRRVVLVDKGSLIVTHGESSHSNKHYSRDRSRSRSREHQRRRSRSRSPDRRHSRDKWRSKEELQRSGSRDRSRRKRRYERYARSRSGSRSDNERYDRSHHHKKKRRDRSQGNSEGFSEKRGLEEDLEEYDQPSGRRKRSPKNSKMDPRNYSRDKSDSGHKTRDKAVSKDKSGSKEGKNDLWKDKHDSFEKVDLREKLDAKNKTDLRDRIDNPFKGDLREKLAPKVKEKIDIKVNSGFKDVIHVKDWPDGEKEKQNETSVSVTRSTSKTSYRVDLTKPSDEKTEQCKSETKEKVRKGLTEGKNPSLHVDENTDVKNKTSLDSVQITKDCPVKATETSAKGSNCSDKAIFQNSLEPTSGSVKQGVLPEEVPKRPAPLLPTPVSFKNNSVHEPRSGPIDAMYDPSMPTDTSSPPVFAHKDQEESNNNLTSVGVSQRSDFVIGNRIQSPSGSGLLGDGGFFLPGEPGMINLLPPHQSIAQIPMSLGMLPPGFPPGIHSVPPAPHLVMNPLILNRPPPFSRMPQVPGGLPRFGWPGVEPRGVIQVPNRFERNPVKDQGLVQLPNRFPGPFPPGPQPLPSRPNPINGGFEGVASEPLAVPRHFNPLFPGREDPRQTLVQSSVQSQSGEGIKQHKLEPPRLGQGQHGQPRISPPPNNPLNPLNEISKLLNLQARLVGLTQRVDANKDGKTTNHPRAGTRGMLPPPPANQVQTTSRPGAGGKTVPASHGAAGFSETMEVVDMDMSPLDDDDNIVTSPEDDQDKPGDITNKVSSVVFLSKHDDLPSSAVELTNKQKVGKFIKKLHLQERVVEEVKLAIKPFYARKKISKDEYKDILRKSVPKICHSRSGNINPAKIKTFIEAYVERTISAKAKPSNGEKVRARFFTR